MNIIVSGCSHSRTYPFHNATNGEYGNYCYDCGAKIPEATKPSEWCDPECDDTPHVHTELPSRIQGISHETRQKCLATIDDEMDCCAPDCPCSH